MADKRRDGGRPGTPGQPKTPPSDPNAPVDPPIPVEKPPFKSPTRGPGIRVPRGSSQTDLVGVRAPERGARKVRVGIVVSDKMDKTVVVSVEDRVKHALYGKVMRRTSRLKAHDEANSAFVGDRVLIMETRPLSKTKRWRVVKIIERAK